jgi:copper chaperone CopZ
VELDMQKKIYVAGMFDDDTAKKVDTAVRGVAGVTNVAANASKAQILVDFVDGTAGIEESIDKAIKSAGVDVLN